MKNNYKNHNNAQANVDERQFEGSNALRLSENYTFGVDALAYLNEKFAHLKRQNGKFNLSCTRYHPHAYAAFSRKFMNRTIVLGCAINDTIVDVGGHGIRTLVSERTILGTKGKWHETIHSMLPILGSADQIRHQNWKDNYRTMDPPVNYPMPNSCACIASGLGVCACKDPKDNIRWADKSTLISIDSAYYPGVISGIEYEMTKNARSSYFAFHDYYKAYLKRKFAYSTFDNEAQVTIDISKTTSDIMVTSRVNKNPQVYYHNVIDTGPNEVWYRTVKNENGDDMYVVYQILESLKQSEHDYVLVKAVIIKEQPTSLYHAKNWYAQFQPLNFRDAVHPLEETSWTFSEMTKIPLALEAISGLSKTTKTLILKLGVSLTRNINRLNPLVGVPKETKIIVSKIDNIEYISYTGQDDFENLSSEYSTYNCSTEQLSFAYETLTNDYGANAAMRAQKRLVQNMREKNPNAIDFNSCTDAISIAMLMVAKDSYRMYKNVHENVVIQKARRAAKGIFDKTSYREFLMNIGSKFATETANIAIEVMQNIKDTIRTYLIRTIWFLVLMTVLLQILNTVGGAGVSAAGLVLTSPAYQPVKISTIFDALLLFLLAKVFFQTRKKMQNNRFKINDKPKILKSCCVIDPKRLDLQLNLGRIPPNWHFRDKDWDITGLTGQQALNKLQGICLKQNHEAAIQIGPILRGEIDRLPVIKHSCPAVMMAASIRACSNKIAPDKMIFKRWVDFYQKIITQTLVNAINLEAGLNIDFDVWLKKYPGDYQDKIRKTLLGNSLFTNNKRFEYKSFPKIEMQFSDFANLDMNTLINQLKERQISVPSEEKKIVANAFINELERIADKYLPEYCGRCNWETICKKIYQSELELKNPIYGFADGSGFDMTQIRLIQKQFTATIKQILNKCAVNLPPEIDKKLLLRAFEDSERLDVTVGQGAATYVAEGRASGDGWTTFGNTLLMISYWKFIFDYANIPRDKYFLLVKGDDVVFAVERQYQRLVQEAINKLMAPKNELIEFGLGQVVKFVKWGDIVDGDFLSNEFFRTSSGIRMTRIPARVFQTLSFSLKTYSGDKKYELHAKELLYSKGHSLLAWSRNLPIFEKLAIKLISLGQQGEKTEYNMYADEPRQWNAEDDDYQAYCDWLLYRYNITREEISQFEEIIENIDDRLDELIIPLIDKFYSGN